MKIKEGLRLRKLGRRYMLVRTMSSEVDMSEVYTFNESAAFIWEKAMEAGEFDVDAVVTWMLDEYDVDEAMVRKDVSALLDEWKANGIVE